VVTLRQPGEFAGFLIEILAQNSTLMRVMLMKSAIFHSVDGFFTAERPKEIHLAMKVFTETRRTHYCGL
jgi:hypothetical protein